MAGGALKGSLTFRDLEGPLGADRGTIARWFRKKRFPRGLYEYSPTGHIRVPASNLQEVKQLAADIRSKSSGKSLANLERGRNKSKRDARSKRTTVENFSRGANVPAWFVQAALNHRLIQGRALTKEEGGGLGVFKDQLKPAQEVWTRYLSEVWGTTPKANVENHATRVRPVEEFLGELAARGVNVSKSVASSSFTKGGVFSMFTKKGLLPGGRNRLVFAGGPAAAQLLKIAETQGTAGVTAATYLWRSLKAYHRVRTPVGTNGNGLAKATDEWIRLSSTPGFTAPRREVIRRPKPKRPPAKPKPEAKTAAPLEDTPQESGGGGAHESMAQRIERLKATGLWEPNAAREHMRRYRFKNNQ
jgi:hypothetical protein